MLWRDRRCASHALDLEPHNLSRHFKARNRNERGAALRHNRSGVDSRTVGSIGRAIQKRYEPVRTIRQNERNSVVRAPAKRLTRHMFAMAIEQQRRWFHCVDVKPERALITMR